MADIRARLVVFDIDGTLLDTANPLSARTAAALRELQQRGLELAFASSRPIGSLELFAAGIGVRAHLIGFNGAVAANASGRRLIAETFVIEPGLTDLLGGFAGAGGEINVYQPTRWLAIGPAAAIDHEEHATGLVADERGDIDTLPGLAGTAALKVMCRGAESARAALLDELADVPGLTVMSSGWDCCDIQAPGSDKGSALAALCTELGIGTADVIALGDSDSDAPMLAVAGHGVSVGSASDRARTAAQTHLAGPGTPAVADWLDRITVGV